MPDSVPGKLVAPEPVPPVRQYSFTNWQTNNPTAPPPGDRLDAEFDRGNGTQSQTLDWVGTSLNPDGTLRTGIVGEAQLVPGLFDDIASDAVDQVQPLVDQAGSYATEALNAANSVASSAIKAETNATRAGQFASEVRTALDAASAAVKGAEDDVRSTASDADRAENAANHADGSEAVAQAYADVGMAWAEHMPDTIPPNILAVQAVTGDHWSSRWWANRTHAIGDDLIESLQTFYLGAFPSPPRTDNQGNPIAVGALYYDLTLGAMYVWNGTAWQPVSAFSPAQTARYVYVATANQTVFTGADRDGHTLAFNPASGQSGVVYENGLLRTPVTDYTATLNTVTMLQPGQAGDIVQIWVETVPVVKLDWKTARLDTSGWVFNGVTTAFPLKDPGGVALIMSAASDVLLSLDGVWQQAVVDYAVASSTLTFALAPPAGSLSFGIAIIPVPDVAQPLPGVASIDTSTWVLNGVNATFPIRDLGGAALIPVAAENLLLSLNGVWQAAVRDYTVAGSTVTFATAPETGSVAFGVAGLPAFGAAL